MAETKTIGVPSVKGMQSSFTDYAVGAGGGLIYGLAQAILGSGFIGSLAAPVLAGSVVKGPRGTASWPYLAYSAPRPLQLLEPQR